MTGCSCAALGITPCRHLPKAAARPAPCCGDPDPFPLPFGPGPAAPADAPRVLFVSHYLKPDGAPTALLNIVPRLRHVRPTVFSWHDGPLRARYEAAGVPVLVGDLPDPAAFDVVVANTTASARAVRAAVSAGVPVVWLVQEATPDWLGNRAELADLMPRVAATVFPTAACRDAYAALRPANPQVIPTLIPPVPVKDRDASRGAMGDEFLVVTFGRDEQRKGQADLREATAGLSGVTVRYLHDDPDPHRYLAAADLYVCTSRDETFPLAPQEAAAHGVPVVSTPAGLLSGVAGDVYQPGDVAALRRLIERHRDARTPRTAAPPRGFDATLSAWESMIRAAARRMPPPAPVRVVYHVAGIGGHWRQIVREQLDQFRAAGLTRVHCTHVGTGLAELIGLARAAAVELVVCSSDADPKQYERPGIRLAHRLALAADGPVLYCHSKGVSRPLHEPVWHEWRRLMARHVVGDWRVHAAEIAAGRIDAAGVNWWTKNDWTHFSGNFWIASAAWLRKLPDPDKYYRDRWSCERWVGATPGCRAKSLVCSDRKFWSDDKDYLLALAAPQVPPPPATIH